MGIMISKTFSYSVSKGFRAQKGLQLPKGMLRYVKLPITMKIGTHNVSLFVLCGFLLLNVIVMRDYFCVLCDVALLASKI